MMIDKIVNMLEEANKKYREGDPIMSDYEYDRLLQKLFELDPENTYFDKVGVQITGDRKRKLDHPMASINKVKSIDDIKDWLRTKNIDTKSEIICTPKYDGLSLLVNEYNNTATTRGDGEYGQKSDDHYKLIQNHLSLDINTFSHTYGEIIIPKKVFLEKYKNDFANPRNLVAGLINSKETTEILTDVQYIKYGAIPNKEFSFKTKLEILDMLNSGQKIKVDYHLILAKDITEEILIELFKKWSIDYEIDGIVLELNSIEKQISIGREKSTNNPIYSVAFKHPSFEQSAQTEIIGITWNISKQGYLKPTLHVNPIRLDGVTVSNVTGNNARFVKDLGLGVGAIVVVKRSGMVIPIIADVTKPVDFVMPDVPNIDWNDNGVELITLSETDDQKLKKLVAFFEILEAKNVSEGVITQLWEAGYQSVKDILNLKTSDLEKIDRFGKRKSTIVYNSIQACVKDVTLSKLQHATGIFNGLGSKKLALLEHFTTKPTVEEVMNIEGFAEISAKSYVNNYDKFFDFIKDLPINIQQKTEMVTVGNDLEGASFVFTGIRVPEYEKFIVENGGKIGSSISRSTTHLVMKTKGSGSSKEKKAIELGIKIVTVDELENMLKYKNY